MLIHSSELFQEDPIDLERWLIYTASRDPKYQEPIIWVKSSGLPQTLPQRRLQYVLLNTNIVQQSSNEVQRIQMQAALDADDTTICQKTVREPR